MKTTVILGFLMALVKNSNSVQMLDDPKILVRDVSNSFVPKLLQTLHPGNQNVVFSPFGIATNMAMLLEGAAGPSAEEIWRLFNLPSNSLEQLRAGFKHYFDLFEEYVLNEEAAGSFNQVGLLSSQALLPDYRSVLNTYYNANVTETNKFANLTGTRPAHQVLELRSDTGVMTHWKDYQALAVYVFLSHKESAPFFVSKDETVPVPMIPQIGVLRHGRIDSLDCIAVELLLEVKFVSLLLLIPDDIDGLDEMIGKLHSVSMTDILTTLPSSEVQVTLPQFATVNSLNLAEALTQLGIETVFNPEKADLSRATNNTDVYLRSIWHEAYFSTSFVSVNSVGGVSSNFVPRVRRDAETIAVDRPFLFFLLLRDTELVLLAGKVHTPMQVP